jgi:hypothetical protein
MNYLDSLVQFSVPYPRYSYPQSHGRNKIGFIISFLSVEGTSREISRLPVKLQITDKDQGNILIINKFLS